MERSANYEHDVHVVEQHIPLSYPTLADPDELLISRAKAGEHEALALLLAKHKTAILRTALRITQNQHDAEDVCQETFLKVYRNLQQFQERSKFSTWIVRIAMNESFMHLRKKRRNTISLDETQEDYSSLIYELRDSRSTPEMLSIDADTSRRLQDAIDALPDLLRSALVLRVFDEYSIEEVSAKLGTSVAATKSRTLRARRLLRRRLGFAEHRS